MKHRASIILLLIFFVLFGKATRIHTNAYNNSAFYGDNTAITWDDIQPHLSPVYQNTPSISISNGYTTKKFNFNIELFWDLGLYVYGTPESVSFTGIENDFKPTNYGYFVSPSNNLKGEYRYLGYSLYGVPITNKRFPNDLPPIPYDDMTLLKYTELPDHLKQSYNISGLSNERYIPLRNIIESPDSPIWNFTNFTNGQEITLRQTLTNIGLFKNNTPLISLLDYGIVYSWNESGGVIRLFYCAKSNNNIIRYATFSGPVFLELNAVFPTLTSKLFLTDNSNSVISNTFYTNANSGYISTNINIDAILKDNLNNLSYFQKLYSYTRKDIEEFNLYIDGKKISPHLSVDTENHLRRCARAQNYSISFSTLKIGKNKFTINGVAEVKIDSTYIKTHCNIDVFIIFEPLPASPSPIHSPLPTHSSIPTPTLSTPAPSNTPKISVRRKW